MTKIILTSLIIALIISSCTNSKQGEKSINTSNKEFYLSKMKEKNFQFENNGPCDDALGDTIHERSIAYFDSKTLTKTNAIIEFKFKDACCKEFLGDYFIENDTLIFKFAQVNDVVCSCLCWYRYKLTINEPNENFKDIKIADSNEFCG